MRITTSFLSLVVCLASSNLVFAEKKFRTPKFVTTDPYVLSDILVSGNTHTLLPKGCILFLPERHKHRLSKKGNGDYISFNDFYAKNYGWLTLCEVTEDQARGDQAFPEGKLKAMKESGKVVVAVLKKNPISVQKAQISKPSK